MRDEGLAEAISTLCDGIRLPVPVPDRGRVEHDGWTVTFSRDTEAGSLDLLLQNRSTNDRHVRVDADGSVSTVASRQTALVFRDDAPDAWERATAELDEQNQRFDQGLREAGLA